MKQLIDSQGNAFQTIDLSKVAYAADIATTNDTTSATKAALVRIVGPSDADVKVKAGLTSPDASSGGITLPRTEAQKQVWDANERAQIDFARASRTP